MKKLKAKLRAWLIDLVREAIRIERTAESATNHPYSFVGTPRAVYPGRLSTPKIKEEQPANIEPSFEQLQAEALQAQEQYYEPRKD